MTTNGHAAVAIPQVRDYRLMSRRPGAGPGTRHQRTDWTFSISGDVDVPKRWTWDEFRKLPSETITQDIHCVTKWSKLDTVWEGVSVDTLLEGVDTSAEYLMAFSDGGYTTYLPARLLVPWCTAVPSGAEGFRLRTPVIPEPTPVIAPVLRCWAIRSRWIHREHRASEPGYMRTPSVRSCR
jgi:DMSO/TMAO reductase YedYZ molybdopterin-dependent catalytic subunit